MAGVGGGTDCFKEVVAALNALSHKPLALPQLGADENYAVVNGQLVQLNDSEYELLQMIRIARAVL